MKTFLLHSERSSMDGIKDDHFASSLTVSAPFGATDVQTLTQHAPIVLSDSEPQITRLYELLMARSGLRTVSLLDGAKVLDYVPHNPVSLVISNLMKPRVTGLELLEALRRDPLTTDIPFIMITATPSYESQQAFQALGGAAYLTKPINAQRLLQTVTQLLSTQLLKQPM